MDIIYRRYFKRMLIVPIVLGCLCVPLALASCVTATVHEAPTPSASAGATAGTVRPPTASATPVAIAAFSCAAGSLPVTSTSTRTNCTVHTENDTVVVHATYMFANPGQFVDEDALMAAGWVIAGLVNEDGQGFSGTWFLYLKQGAWISWGPTQDGMMNVWASVPMNNAPIRCGKTFAGSTSPHVKVPLPQGTQTVAVFQIAPYCLQDVESFYTTTLAAAGWTADGSFSVASASDGGVSTASATYVRNGESVHLSLVGADGTSTEISVN